MDNAAWENTLVYFRITPDPKSWVGVILWTLVNHAIRMVGFGTLAGAIAFGIRVGFFGIP